MVGQANNGSLCREGLRHEYPYLSPESWNVRLSNTTPVLAYRQGESVRVHEGTGPQTETPSAGYGRTQY